MDSSQTSSQGTSARLARTASPEQQQQQEQLQFQPTVTTWDRIRQPGAYVDLQSGELYRIPAEAIVQGELVIDRQSSRQIELLHVSDNPFITNQQAGRIAARNNVTVSFR